MARKKNRAKKKTWYKDRSDEAVWTPFDTVNSDAWRDHLLQLSEPRIPFSIALKEHVYECIEGGSTGKPVHIFYVKGQRYDVRKSRWHEDFVEVRGLIHNSRTGVTFMHTGWMSVPKENCIKYLKPW